MTPAITAQNIYEQLKTSRESFLRAARRASELTIPFLFPPEGHSSSTIYYTPFQGVGADGVKNLASKLLIALLPPNSPFFRLAIDRFELKKVQDNPKMQTALESALSEVERSVVSEIETAAVRVSLFECLKHIIVGGNVLLYVPESAGVRVFHLDRYVVKRDPMGNVLTIITKETVAPDTLPQEVQKMVKKVDEDAGKEDCKTLDIYTYISRKRKASGWKVWQEIQGEKIPGTEGSYPTDKCPWLPLRWSKIDGEDYGRGLVEECIGDLSSLEALSQALVEGAAAAAKVLFLVDPNGPTRIQALRDTPNGGFASGVAENVSTLQLNKFYDFKVVQEQAAVIEKRLERSFLLTSGATRQAERVTAEEVRAMIQELESTLGGVYSIQSQEMQLPLVGLFMNRMSKDGRLPKLPKGIVKPTIVTGLDALGRGNDAQKLVRFAQTVGQTYGPEALAKYTNVQDFLDRLAAAEGIDTEGLLKTEEDLAAANQQEQQMALVSRLGPEGLRQMGQMAQNQQKAGLQAPPQ